MRNFTVGFTLSAILFTGLGYWWAKEAYTRTFEIRLEQKQIIIDHYREHWTPIRNSPVRARVK